MNCPTTNFTQQHLLHQNQRVSNNPEEWDCSETCKNAASLLWRIGAMKLSYLSVMKRWNWKFLRINRSNVYCSLACLWYQMLLDIGRLVLLIQIQHLILKAFVCFIIQQCPTYNNKRWSRRILNEINIYCQYIILTIWSKIEKVPRGIRGEKSSKDMASSRNLVSTIGALASPKMGDVTRCREG